MPTTITRRYYPTLSSVVSADDIPEVLGFIKEGIVWLFDKIHYKDLQYSKSPRGDAAFYSLSVVTPERLAIEVPGTGIYLVLNPDLTGGNYSISSFPITVEYQWKVLAYLRAFSAGSFSFAPQELFEVALRVLNISEEEAMARFVTVFSTPSGASVTPLEQYVADVNTAHNLTLPAPTASTKLSEVSEQIHTQTGGQYSSLVGFSTYLSNPDVTVTMTKLKVFFKAFVPEDLDAYIKDILMPKFKATLQLSAGVEFPRSMLKPVYDENGFNPFDGTLGHTPFEVIPADNPPLDPDDPEYPKVMLTFAEALFYADTKQGFGYNLDLVLNTTVPAQIGNTGLIIEIQNLKLDLSRTSNIAEANTDGRPPEFMGFYTEQTDIILPKKWFKQDNSVTQTLKISAKKLLVGTGGLSGTIALEALVAGNPIGQLDYFWFRIGGDNGFRVGFNRFDITFRQSVVAYSNIRAAIQIPKLKDSTGNPLQIDVLGHLDQGGDFNLTASVAGGIEANLFDFVTFNFLTLELGKEDKFYIGTSCEVWFQNPIMAKIFGNQKIILPKLRIYENGHIEIVGGNAFIPLNISLDLGPVDVAVTGIHFGSHQQLHDGVMRNYNYWGFDGAISIDPLGIDARGEGIKYYYTIDNDEHGGNGDSFIRVQTIEVDMIIPGSANPATAAAIIHGMVSIPEPGDSPEYQGELSFKMPKAKIAAGASMRLQPKHPAFIVDAHVDQLPQPIPIGPVGIYGFRGLLGYRYVAEKEAVGLVSGQDTWYDYYVHPPRGINISKFSGPERSKDYDFPFSVGVGAVIGTLGDDGTSISVRAMLLLSLPSMFMIEGKASILSTRLGLTDTKEPPFFAFIAWGDNSIEMGMGADFKMPTANGNILDLYAEVQAAFFFENSSAWYINFGTKEKPIQSEVLAHLFRMKTYLMISARGIEAGARADFELKKQFGPAKVHLRAYLELGGKISFEKPQVGGYLAAGGMVAIDIWIVSVDISLDALFSVEAPKPFLIFAEIDLHVCIRILFARVCKDFTIQLKWEKDNSVDRTPIPPLPYSQGVNRSEELVKGIQMLTNETFDLSFIDVKKDQNGVWQPSHAQISAFVPLDTFIDIKTVKSLVPNPALSAKIGGFTTGPENYTDLIPPEKVVRGGYEVRQVKHKYSIEDIELKIWNGSSWEDYHPAEAVTRPIDRPLVAGQKIGYWQKAGTQYNSIRLLANNPFSFIGAGEPGWFIPEQYGIMPSQLFCTSPLRDFHCANALNETLNTIYYPPTQFRAYFINGAYFTIEGVPQSLVMTDANGLQTICSSQVNFRVTDVPNFHNYAQSLEFDNGNSLIIFLPEPSVEVNLKLSTFAQGVTVEYYESARDDTAYHPHHILLDSVYIAQTDLHQVVNYQNQTHWITKIVITPDSINAADFANLQQQIADILADSYINAQGVVTAPSPANEATYRALMTELETMMAQSCSTIEAPGACSPDELLCTLYAELRALYSDCFIELDAEKLFDYCQHQDCYRSFYEIIVAFDGNNPDYNLISQYLFGELDIYVVQLNQLIDWCASQKESSDTVLPYYNSFKDNAWAIITIIGDLGECACGEGNQIKKCTTSLQQVCWMTLEDWGFNMTLPGAAAIEEEQQLMQSGIENTVQTIWRPNSTFYFRFRLKDEVDNGPNSGGTQSFYDYYYGFKTAGPIGHFHNTLGISYGNELDANGNILNRKDANGNASLSGKLTNPDKYPLTSLRSYIDYNRSYPNADGNLLQAKPLFYGHHQCKIALYFTKPLVYQMFNRWYDYQGLSEIAGELYLAVKDPVTDVVIPYPLPVNYQQETVPLPENPNLWLGDNYPLMPIDLLQINNIINAIAGNMQELECTLTIGDPIAPLSYVYQAILTNLKPLKLYTALVYNAFDKNADGNLVADDIEKVHEFVFQTSRYAHFEEQVNSYLLEDEVGNVKQAVFELPLSLSQQQIDTAYSIIIGTPDAFGDSLRIQFYHDFDRVIEGVFGMPPMPPATTTEFNLLKDSTSGETHALLIRNPEPFNNPKIPVAEIMDTISVLFASSNNVNDQYKVLYSKDYAQVLIMHSSKQITADELRFKFLYKTWNGNAYAVDTNVPFSEVITDIIQLNP